MSHIESGARVMYARTFLRSIGAITGSLPFREGTVLFVAGEGRSATARVNWHDDNATGTVLLVNLVAKNRRHLESV